MPPLKSSPHADQRTRLLEVAFRMLEDSGPEALQARTLTAEIGTSTQAVYTLFGGMPGLFEALAADGFARLARHVKAVLKSDDPVADHFANGAAYCDWALAHPQLYRLMFGLAGDGRRLHARFDSTSSTLASFPEGQAALEVLVRSVELITESGRIRPVDSLIAAGQFLSATHGYVLLEIAGAFGHQGHGLTMIEQLAINLMVGLGDSREAAEQSWQTALADRAHPTSSQPPDPNRPGW